MTIHSSFPSTPREHSTVVPEGAPDSAQAVQSETSTALVADTTAPESSLPDDPAKLQALIEEQRNKLLSDEEALKQFLEALEKGDSAIIAKFINSNVAIKGTILDRDSNAKLEARYGKDTKISLCNVEGLTDTQIEAQKQYTSELFPNAQFEIVKDALGNAQLATVGFSAAEVNAAFKLDHEKRVAAFKLEEAEAKLESINKPVVETPNPENQTVAEKINAAIASLTTEGGLREASGDDHEKPATVKEMPLQVVQAVGENIPAAVRAGPAPVIPINSTRPSNSKVNISDGKAPIGRTA